MRIVFKKLAGRIEVPRVASIDDDSTYVASRGALEIGLESSRDGKINYNS